MRIVRSCLTAACMMVFVGIAWAASPQTIVIDGINDFAPDNLVDDDTGDTQPLCGSDRPLDLGKVYITNDASYLYFGFEYNRFCFENPKPQVGMAIDVNTPAGGTTDPFGRQIGWSLLANRPDFVVYDVVPSPFDPYNYEVLYQDNGAGGWNVIHDGANGLGIADADGGDFKEGRILLSDLGVSTGSVIHFEYWVTQDCPSSPCQKGPLDAAYGDAVQMSRATSTTFDTTDVVEMPGMFSYTILDATDNTPPEVSSAVAVNFPLLANKTFTPLSNQIELQFTEPVDQASAEMAGNYAFSGPVSRTVVTAVKTAPNEVSLTLNSAITSNASFYNITVTGVKDIAGNTIVANGTTNVASFFIQSLIFNGDMRLRFCNGEFAATDTFAVEGSLSPLTFTVADNARMYDANMDTIYTTTVPFSMSKDPGIGKAEADLLWKFSHTPSADPFEPDTNRYIRLSSDSGATVTIAASWAGDKIGTFTTHDMDVIFQVKAGNPYVAGTHKFWLQGSVSPLTFDKPGLEMKDDGVFPDLTASDGIFTAIVRFPQCSSKDVNWKVTYDSTATDTVFECPGQGDRSLYLNDAEYDIVGGTLGPLVLPARGVNRCNYTDKAIAVTFKVFMGGISPVPVGGDTVEVAGSQLPLDFSVPPAVPGTLADDGVAPDATAGDGIYTGTVTFPDSTGITVDFKYWFNQWTNSGFECEGFGNRSFDLDDQMYSVGSPYVRNLDAFNVCQDLTAVAGPVAAAPDVAFAVLNQSVPNPASRAMIGFGLRRAGHVTLRIYDVSGRRVAELLNRTLQPGRHQVTWDGRDSDGRLVRSGIYLYELAMNRDRVSRHLVLVR